MDLVYVRLLDAVTRNDMNTLLRLLKHPSLVPNAVVDCVKEAVRCRHEDALLACLTHGSKSVRQQQQEVLTHEALECACVLDEAAIVHTLLHSDVVSVAPSTVAQRACRLGATKILQLLGGTPEWLSALKTVVFSAPAPEHLVGRNPVSTAHMITRLCDLPWMVWPKELRPIFL
jgi:hypothetical protein